MDSEQIPEQPKVRLGHFCRADHPVQVANGYCSICAKCTICSKNLTAVEYSWVLQQAQRNDTEPVFEHPGCFRELDRLTLSSETIEIPKALFDKLNACRLMIEPLEDLNVKTNEQDADIQTQRWMHLYAQGKTHAEYMEHLYLSLRKLESAAATVSLAVSKARRAIEQSLDDRDRENYAKARSQRSAQSVQAPKAIARAEKKQLSKEDKFLETYMKQTGLSRAEATESLEHMKAQKAARAARTLEATSTNEETIIQ